MSAFIVNKKHIDAMIYLATIYDMTWWDGKNTHSPRNETDSTGQMLLDENIASVEYRYGKGDDLPGPVDAYWRKPYRYTPLGRYPSPVEGLKLINCYEYQSCEHPGWEKSNAKRFCETLKAVLISRLPGYDEALWEWE